MTATGQFMLNLKKYIEGTFIAILTMLLAGPLKHAENQVKQRFKECEIQVSLYLAHFTARSSLHAEHCFVTLSCFEDHCSYSISLH